MRGALRAPWAFFMRDLRREISYKIGFALDIVGVTVDVSIYYFIARVFGGAVAPFLQAYGGDYFAFVIIGVAFTSYMNVGVNVIAGSVRGEQIGGTFELMLLSPTRLGVMLSSFPLWDYTFATLTVLAYLIVGGMLGMGFQHANLPMAMLSLGLSVASFTALGLSAASLTIVLKSGNPLGWMIRVSSLLLSGVYYPVDVLPVGLRGLAQALPLTHALTLMRRSLLRGEGLATLWGELLALLGLTLVLIVLGVLACRAALHVARTDGSLSHQ